MLKNFENNLTKILYQKKQNRILLAVSGGADSIAMLDLFSKTDHQCGIAHCNFHLRGNESDEDEKMVKKLAKKYNMPFFKTDFETVDYAKNQGISIEMAARELRYEWFEEIRKTNDYQHIAVAHHQDDIIETFLINLTRGTGIRGLTGIKEISGNIIRPMLFANRKQILEYILENGLVYREDSTNSDTNIIRNGFRHQILPLLNKINPSVSKNILQTIDNLKDAEIIVNKKIEEIFEESAQSDKDFIQIFIDKLVGLEPLKPYLYELLSPYNFNAAQVNDIIRALDAEPGRKFFSSTHELIRDREALIIQPIKQKESFSTAVGLENEIISLPKDRQLLMRKIKNTADFKIPHQKNQAAIDLDKLKLPLKIRGWEQGDFFYPLGMKKKKKLSDFFTDIKYSYQEKKDVLILLSDNQIVWILEERLDNRFKITDETKNILLIEIK